MNKELSKEEIIESERVLSELSDWQKEVLVMVLQDFADQEKRELQKENKELKEKITELEGVIAKLSQKVILYECNY